MEASGAERVLASWQSNDLRAKCDELAVAVASAQEEARAARQTLTERFKAWRKNDETERLATVMELIREFQGNDDKLQKRAKFAETALAALGRDLRAAHDPVAALAAAAETARALAALQESHAALFAEASALRATRAPSAGVEEAAAAEAAKLRAEVGALERELSQLSNQDITIRELEARLGEMEGSIETQVTTQLASREADLRAIFDAELDDVREAEAAAEARVAALAGALHDAQLARDEAQAALYTVRSRAEEEVSSARSDADTTAASLERVTRALAVATATGEEWKRKVHAVDAGGAGEGPSRSAATDALRARSEAAEEEASRLAQSVAALSEENRRWGGLLEAARVSSERSVSELRGSVEERDKECARLRADLAMRPTAAEVGDLRRHLSLVQAVHFGGGGEGEEEEGASSGFEGGEGGADIHSIMLRRIRSLEGRALRSEGERREAVAEAERLRGALTASSEALEEQRAMVAQLDEVLSGRLTAPEGPPSSPTSRGRKDEQLSLILASPSGSGVDAPASATRLIMGPPPTPSSSALEAALRGQRDKFRARMLELESEGTGRSARLAEAGERCAALQADNVRLYEKVRFLQSSSGGGGRGNGAALGPSLRSRAGGAGDAEEPFEAEYGAAYREGLLDPLDRGGAPPSGEGGLTDFRAGEKARTIARLSAGQQLTVRGSRLFLANSFARRAALVYAACLHLLVLATTLHFATTTHGEGECAVGAGGGRPRLGALPAVGASVGPG
jgi:homeobox protein cut-like